MAPELLWLWDALMDVSRDPHAGQPVLWRGRRLGAVVDERIYQQMGHKMGHTVNRDEVQTVHALLMGAK